MSQTTVQRAPGGVQGDGTSSTPGGGGSLSARVASASTSLRHSLDGTPGRLRVVATVSVLAALLIALGGGAALRERSAALDAAWAASAHLVLLQGVQTDLVQADADATNSFLAFGQEPRSQRVDYISSIREASRDLTLAAAASPQDAAALGAANAALTRYTGYVASARANNAQGLPVGASYLKTASELLRSDVLPKITERTAADEEAVASAYTRAGLAALWLALVALVGLGALAWAQLELARRSRRYLNVPLAAATVAVLLGLVLAGAAMAVAQSRANDVRENDLAEATALSTSRVAAFNAKSIESLTLVNRGSGVDREPVWQQEMAAATASLGRGDPAAVEALEAYQAEHRAIRKLDDDGDWQQARTEAVSLAPGSANARFGVFAAQTERTLTERASASRSGLADAGDLLLPAGLLLVALGLLAAVACWWGVSLRLDEYR